ncbi:MAG: hypothetical protein GY708_18810 [Actinomycetia bacterium]|nr:hypothetical protein [Actinomycetes bacterium]
MATTSISLIRPQTERTKPPRALWVSFDLGRPLGSADDPSFQKNVMRAAFRLLETATEHTIEDYPIDPPDEVQAQQWACPLNLGPKTDDSLTGRLLAEVARLKPWSAETRTSRGGRTLFGASGAATDQVDEVAKAIGGFADSGELPESDIEWVFEMPLLVRHLADDLRTHYHEAIEAQPGSGSPNHAALNKWIFGGTALGDTLLAAADQLTDMDTPMSKLVRGLLIPEGFYRGEATFG